MQSYVVGLAGGTASGKSTFTAHLVTALTAGETPLTVEVRGMDKYFYRGEPGGPRFVSPSSGELLPHNNHPDSADNARFVADLDERRHAPDAPAVLLVEGLMILHVAAIRERLDLRLFLDLDADIRALRRMQRDMSGVRGNADPKFIATYYNECAREGHRLFVEPSRRHADLILRGDGNFPRMAGHIAAIVRAEQPASLGR